MEQPRSGGMVLGGGVSPRSGKKKREPQSGATGCDTVSKGRDFLRVVFGTTQTGC
jgi:hypothetical protein